MADAIEITLCMGSSCFARGNNRLLAELEAMIRRNNWDGKVRLAGSRCRNRCGDGPNLAVDGEARRDPDVRAIESFLADRLEQAEAAPVPDGGTGGVSRPNS